jgi:hypothetical protein
VGAVGRAEIDYACARAVSFDSRMAARDVRVFEHDPIVPLAPDRDRITGQRILSGLTRFRTDFENAPSVDLPSLPSGCLKG